MHVARDQDPTDDALETPSRTKEAVDDMLTWRTHIVFTPGISWQPPIDVYETETEVIVRMEIAGVDVEDLDIRIERDLVTIAGVREGLDCEEDQIRCVHHREIASGRFERTIKLPCRVSRQDIRARLKDGFLEITLKRDADRPDTLAVHIT